MICEFYLQDDVSRTTAGKKETLTKSMNKKQRHYLLDSMKNFHIKFKKDVPLSMYLMHCFADVSHFMSLPQMLIVDIHVCVKFIVTWKTDFQL